MDNETLKYWQTVELTRCATGRVPEIKSPDEAVYSELMQNWDAKSAVLLCRENPVMPLQKIRAFLQRGDLEEASLAIESLEQKSEDGSRELYETEVLLEKARLSAFTGNWQRALELANCGINGHPVLVTLLSLLQVRSVAFFELGEFQKALKDVELIESRAQLLPHTIVGKYAQALKIKIQARQLGVNAAQQTLDVAWKSFIQSGSLNLEIIVTLLRVEIDINRLAGKCIVSLALATHEIASITGDRLYQGLALLDLSVCVQKSEIIENLLSGYRNEFLRIKNLEDEITRGIDRGSSTTAKSMVPSAQQYEGYSLQYLEKILASTNTINKVILVRRNLVVQLRPFVVTKKQISTKLIQALSILSEGPISKVEFFGRLWGSMKFVSHLHDPAIRSLISRIRRVSDIQVESVNAVLSVEPILVAE